MSCQKLVLDKGYDLRYTGGRKGELDMTTKDFEFLARTLYMCVAAGEMKEMTVRVIASELDKQYPNFNRDRFEDAALPQRGTA